LQKFVTKFQSPPNLILQNLFSSTPSPSATIKWESQMGSRGMTPFVPPGAPAPQTSPLGVAEHIAEAAFWKEKMYFDEEFLNNIRKEGTENQYMAAAARLAREMANLVNRCNRRREWMFAKMLFSGSFQYKEAKGTMANVNYSLPTGHQVSLATDYKWNAGTSRNVLGDIIDGKKVVNDSCGARVNMAVCNSTVLKYLAQDPDLLTLLSKSNFGAGDLFKGATNNIVGVNPKVIGALLDIDNMVIYDEQYEVRALLTGAVTGGATSVIPVDSPVDFEAGGTLRFWDVSAGTYEDETIASIQRENMTVTVSTAPSVSFKAGEDYVTMTKKFVPDDKFSMVATTVDGQPIAEYKTAPYGLARLFGLSTDRKEKWDPEGIFIRVRDKGLPVLYFRDAIYNLTVA